MDIYIVHQGDTVQSIAEMYDVTVDKLIQDNGLDNPFNLAIGQTIVITYPKQEHIAQEGDTLNSIADTYQVSIMQLLWNNPQLSNREYLYPGETIVISYNTSGSITTTGIAYPYITRKTLNKVLPSLTYLSVFNYTAIEKGYIKTYFDDSEIIQIAKQYHVVPLLMITSLTTTGEQNIETAYELLTTEEYLENHVNQLLDTIKTKGYLGLHIIINYLQDNQNMYINFLEKLSIRFKKDGLLLFATVNITLGISRDLTPYKEIDYPIINKFLDGIMFLHLVW